MDCREQMIIDKIMAEVERAEELHPNWPDDLIHAAAIVCEESGELIRAALNHYYHGEKAEKIYIETIQVAASAIRLLKNF